MYNECYNTLQIESNLSISECKLFHDLEKTKCLSREMSLTKHNYSFDISFNARTL